VYVFIRFSVFTYVLYVCFGANAPGSGVSAPGSLFDLETKTSGLNASGSGVNASGSLFTGSGVNASGSLA